MLFVEGLIAGLIAGGVMGFLSHAGFRARIFKSSLFIIDGSFALKRMGKQYEEQCAVLVGVPVHLVTSMSFGLAYAFLVSVMHVGPTNGWILALYVTLLWLSMLFVALPVAGHGFLGKGLGKTAWFEQLILHLIFGIGLWVMLHLLHQ